MPAGSARGVEPDRTPAAVIPSHRLRRPQGLPDCNSAVLRRDELDRETIYRRHFIDLVRMPVFLAALVGFSLIFEQLRSGSVLPFGADAGPVLGSFIVTLSLLWSVLRWYGNYVLVSDRHISINNVTLFFRSANRMISWGEIKDVSMSGGFKCLGIGDVYLITGDGRSLRISNIPEPEYLYEHIRTKLSP